MNLKETTVIMAILKEAYPYYYKDKTKEELITSINLWQEMFTDDDVNLVKAAIKVHISTDTKGFPPVIGQIKNSIHKITQQEEMTEQQAWSLISKAICNSAYNATTEYDKLPKLLQIVAGSPAMLREWSQMDSETVQSVVASNFMRSYKVKASNEKEYQALPNDIKQLMSSLSNKLMIGSE